MVKSVKDEFKSPLQRVYQLFVSDMHVYTAETNVK